MRRRNLKPLAFVALPFLLVGGLVRSAQADSGKEIVPGELLVGIRPSSDRPSVAGGLLADIGTAIGHSPQLHVIRIRLHGGMTFNAAIARLRKRVDVLYAEANGIYHATSTPNDPLYATQQWGPHQIEADLAWGMWQPHGQVIIAMVDTGIDYTHPDLANKILRDASGAIVGHNSVGSNAHSGDPTDPADDAGHGTHTAGIAAAQINNALGIAGIAGWNGQPGSSDSFYTKLMPVKVLSNSGSGSDATVADGITWAADHGARVINLSLGGSSSTTMANAVTYAWNKGCVIVAAAGNNHSSAPFYPAAYPNVISVAATDKTDTLASFSTYGSWVLTAAPGRNIYSTTPTYKTGNLPLNYALLSGTSMATPHVSGEAALLLAQNTSLTNVQVNSLITGSYDPYFPYSGRTIAPNAGRINVYAALQASGTSGIPLPPTGLAATPGDRKVSLAWNASTGAASYNVKRSTSSGGPYNTIAAGVLNTSYVDIGLANGTTYYYAMSAVNTFGESANSSEVSATPEPGSIPGWRINCGGGAYKSTSGDSFDPDRGFSGGYVGTVTGTITGTSDPALYQHDRRGTSFKYVIAGVADGSYTLRLHFLEPGFTHVGERKFNVTANGTPILTNFDIFAEALAVNKALVKSFSVNVSGGSLTLQFTGTTRNAIVSAIELLQTGS